MTRSSSLLRALTLLLFIPLTVAISTAADTDRSVARTASISSVERRNVAVPSTPTVHVNVGTGSVRVHTWMHDRVSAGVSGASRQRLDVSAVSDGAVVVIDTVVGDSSVLDVYVPFNARISVYVGDGDVFVEGLMGLCELHVGSGNIHLANVRGQIDAHSDDGTIFRQVRNEYGVLEDIWLGDNAFVN